MENGNYWLLARKTAGTDSFAQDYRVGKGRVAFRYAGPDIGGRTKEYGFLVIPVPHDVAAGRLTPCGNRKIANDRNKRHQLLVLPQRIEMVERVKEN